MPAVSVVRRAALNRRLGRMALVAGVVAAMFGCGLPAAHADTPSLTPLTSETFTGASTATDNWVLPGGGAACMTAGTSTGQGPVPGCGFATPDAAGDGALRLTDNSGNAVGTVYNTVSLPDHQGP